MRSSRTATATFETAWCVQRRTWSSTSAATEPASQLDPTGPLPRPDARLLSGAPTGGAALYVANASDGSHRWLCGGAGRPMSSSSEIWHANEWMREITTGRVESITYAATDGTPLTTWLLLPPDYAPGEKMPVITIVYPGKMYGAAEPPSFSPYQIEFEHPQLFAALGYVASERLSGSESPVQILVDNRPILTR